MIKQTKSERMKQRQKKKTIGKKVKNQTIRKEKMLRRGHTRKGTNKTRKKSNKAMRQTNKQTNKKKKIYLSKFLSVHDTCQSPIQFAILGNQVNINKFYFTIYSHSARKERLYDLRVKMCNRNLLSYLFLLFIGAFDLQ